jgi:transcriptional regulator with XRE-family HTH domain
LLNINAILADCNFAIDFNFSNGEGMPEDDRFDRDAFYAALNAARLSRQKTWKDVAEESGVNASTLSRIGQGANPDVNGLAALLQWANLKAETFIRGTRRHKSEPIAEITALLRADPNLSKPHAKLIEDIVVSTYNKLKGT